MSETNPIRVLVWNEFLHEKEHETVKNLYPDGIHETLARHLRAQPGFEVRTATLEEPEHGLTQAALDATDVLLWWGHMAHERVTDAVVDRVQARVLAGMGLIVLHSGHFSKVFKRLMGTSCGLKWREAAEKEKLWVVNPYHPITQGIDDGLIELPYTEMYGEVFDVPTPDDLLFISWFEGGEVFRSGMTWHRGQGKIFYFRPGHETYPVFHDANVLRVITNAARWCGRFEGNPETVGIGGCMHMPFAMEPISEKDYHTEPMEHPDSSNA